jgi:hypothetical protein
MWAALLVSAATLLACGDGGGGGPARCTPGLYHPCRCAGGLSGGQLCGQDGRFGACECAGETTDATTAPPDAETTSQPATPCEGATGPILRLSFPEARLEVTAFDLTVETNDRGVVGMAGRDVDGRELWFGRDGDHGDGQFDEVGRLDAGRYPYHLVLDLRSAGVSEFDCVDAPEECLLLFGLAGEWHVTTTGEKVAARFEIDAITKDEDCWTDTGESTDLTGCEVLEGQISGCFELTGF